MSSSTANAARRARASSEPRGTLPAPLTAFVGREKAVAAVAELVATQRLVTLIGVGGSGKTRLSIEVARAGQGAFADGVVWVELAPLHDAELVPQTVAAALGIRHQPGRGAADAVAEYLAGRRVLLVLDNCEHVIDAAAELTVTLLHDAPGVHILTTSRERLGVPGERTWPVPPLALPPRSARSMDQLLGADAVRLFMDRAAMVLPVFSLDAEAARAIAGICTRLDGIPLAIELAAARMNVLSPQQIGERLADSMSLLTAGARTLPKRQRTLRSAIDWSHALLSDEERVLFRRLAVFGGGFSLEAAEAVCGDELLPPGAVLDVLAGLVDKSLVAVRERDGEARYRLLETVRQYAREHLIAAGDTHGTHRRHAEYYCRVVVENAPALRSAVRPRALAVLDAERDNIRAALDWSRDTPGFGALHHAMLGQLWWFWLHRVLWDEGVQRFSAALTARGGDLPADLLADTFYGAGVLSWVNGMPLQARLWLEEALRLRRGAASDPGALGLVLCALGPALLDLGERDAALALVREGMPLVRQHRPLWDVAMALTSSYGYVLHAGGLLEDAEQACLEADTLWSDPADEWGRALALNSLAILCWRRGDLERASAVACNSLRFSRSTGDRWFAARTLQVLGYIAMQQHDNARATRLLAASEAVRAEVGARLMPFEVPEWIRATETARTALGRELYGDAWRTGLALDFEAAIAYALELTPDGVQVPAREAAPQPAAPVRVEPPTPEAPEPALGVRALGQLEVRRDGRLVTSEEWTYAKPRELLLYLLCHPQGRTKEQVGLDLWPESPPARLRSSFHVTLHHLRRVLGAPDWVTFAEGRYRFERIQPFAFDLERFEALLAADPTARNGADPAERIARLEAALALYRGDFLDDAGFGDWTDEVRAALRRRSAEAAVELATLYAAAGRPADAAETCRRLLARDNLEERAHRLLMQALADAGRVAEAMRHYQVMVALFSEELGVTPSAETEQLARQLATTG